MSRAPHYLHIYEKPAMVTAGTVVERLQRRLPALNYRHKISANGGFDTASCDLAIDRAEAEYIFGDMVGNRVAVYVDNPLVPIWEGLISRVTILAGGIEISRSLEAMANRITAQFTDGTLDLTQTAEATDTASIAIYGSKMKTLDMGEMYTDATTAAEALRDARSAQLAYPVVTTTGGNGDDYTVSVEMIGFYHTLTWDTFEEVDAGTSATAPEEILINGTGDDYSYNYGIFYDDTDASRIAGTAFNINNSRQLGESSWDLLQRIAEAGDSGTRRIVGIAPAHPITGVRLAYYEDADTTIYYATRAYADGRIYTLYGQEVNPWDVRPNHGIRINNILIGQPDGSSDAKTAYITSIDYDAESGQVTWVSDDNLSLEGVFNLDVYNKSTNDRFGAERRDVLINPLPVGRIAVIPRALVYNNAAIAVNSATVTYLTFNSERVDTDGMHSILANTDRLTCQTAGHYIIIGNVGFESNSTGYRELGIVLNGATTLAVVRVDAVATANTFLNIVRAYDLAIGDYVTLYARHTAGIAINVLSAGNYTPEFSITWQGN